MGDVIHNANVIRVSRDGRGWCALIGPDAQQGVLGCGPNPVSALFNLVWKLARYGWPFDASWSER